MGLGYIEFTVAGVKFSAMRLADESHDRYQLSGRAIECDNGLTAEEKVEVVSCEYCCEDYEFDVDDVTDEDIIVAIDCYPGYLVADESGESLGFDAEEDIPEGCKILDTDEAIGRLVAEHRDDIDFEEWA